MDVGTVNRPTGTITFLFSDIEGSTAAWETAPTRMPSVLARHDELLRAAIERHDGYVFATGGDGFAVAFSRPSSAVAAAVDAQRAVRSEPWPDGLGIRVRMAINTGEVDERNGDYFGPPVNRTARLMTLAAGGQVVLAQRTAEHVHQLPDGVGLEERGLHRLKDLRRPESVSELVIDAVVGPALHSSPSSADRLPSARTSFVGREGELVALGRAVDAARLVTLVGPGGAGKTRLAVEHAGRIVQEYPDGVWFVDLSEAAATDVGSCVSTSVGLPGAGDWGPLRRWRALLVLDNCEHVLEAAAEVIDDLLDECPGLCLIATSREALAVDGEQVVRVGSMSATGGEATRLFVERARAIDSRFDPGPDDLEAIAELCRGIDGLPLAIELAASRVGTVDLGRMVTDLFDEPGRRQRRRTARHRSLDAVVRWSADLMDDATRTVFRRVSVFVGGFTLDAAIEVVVDDHLTVEQARAAIATLVDQSMLQTSGSISGGRFSMLETIRSFALGELGDDERVAVGRRHLDWVTGWSRDHVGSPEMPGWFNPTTEVGNQRAALDFALSDGDGRAAVEVFALSLGSLISAGSYRDLASTIARLRSMSEATDPEVAGWLDECEMWNAEIFGDFERSRSLAERFRNEDDERRWYQATSLVIHHLAALAPRDGDRLLGEFEARSGVVPRSSYLRAELAFGESRLSDAVDALFGAFGADDVAGVERRLRRVVGSDPVILADLALALHLLDRPGDAAAVLDLLADTTIESFSCYVPLVRGVVVATTDTSAALAELGLASELERRWEPPLVVNDCVVVGSLVAAEVGRADVAAEALGSMRGMPQRSASGFGVRRVLRRRLTHELGEDGWRAATERGSGRTPREAFAHLVGSLSSPA